MIRYTLFAIAILGTAATAIAAVQPDRLDARIRLPHTKP